MKVSVVIPFYNHWDLTHALLFDLYNYCKGIDEVLLIDNGSTEKDGRDWWIDNGMLPIRVLRIPENIGFLKAANYGMVEAKGDVLTLISNDVSIKENIIETIREYLRLGHVIVGGRCLDFDTGWNTFDGKVFPYLEGWLIGCTKPTWEELGGFDDYFAPNDYEDIDFSTKAIVQGYTLVALDSPQVRHISGATIGYNPQRLALTEANRVRFKKKWMS